MKIQKISLFLSVLVTTLMFSISVSAQQPLVADLSRTQKVSTADLENNQTSNFATMAQSAKLLASDGAAFDGFGGSVAVSGNTCVVGAHGDDVFTLDEGSAYVYIRGENGWIQQAKLFLNDGRRFDAFGISVAIENDIIVVGASGVRITGAAYIYKRTGTTWTLQQELFPSDSVGVDNYGSSVAISNGTIVVGSQGHNSFQGAAYVYVPSEAGWTEQAKLIAPDGAGNDAFGASVGIDGNTIISGAQNNLNKGAAYIFVRNAGIWTQQAKLTSSDGESYDRFGAFVAISGNTLAISASDDRVGTNPTQGSAYVFVRNGANWTQQAKLTASDGEEQNFFGASIDISNNLVIVGSIFNNVGTNYRQGAAYIYERSGINWTEKQKLVSEDGTAINTFGRGVGIDNRTAIAGSPASDFGGNNDQGAAYIFSSKQQTLFDFDGDGRADNSVFRPSGRVWYLLGSQTGFTGTQFGFSTDIIAPADFDGDGRTDISVFRDGTWYWLNSSNSNFNAVKFGQANDIPLPADYTGDGRAELAVYRGGIWYTFDLANNQSQVVQFGIASDKPVPADFDGDGKTDFAVYRDGVWYLLRSSQGFTAVQYGNATDKPTVGDYDGDGRADQAVYRSGVWYVLGSTQGSYAVEFGVASDIPVAADYDGDGKTDLAVFRDGIWYMLRSQQGFEAVQFGIANDKPIPVAFVP